MSCSGSVLTVFTELGWLGPLARGPLLSVDCPTPLSRKFVPVFGALVLMDPWVAARSLANGLVGIVRGFKLNAEIPGTNLSGGFDFLLERRNVGVGSGPVVFFFSADTMLWLVSSCLSTLRSRNFRRTFCPLFTSLYNNLQRNGKMVFGFCGCGVC